MKKLFILIATIIPFATHAADMCVRNDTVMTVFDPTINGSTSTNNATYKTWSTTFSYGVISGIAGCSSQTPTVRRTIATNQDAITTTSTGAFCYCKVLRPFRSLWVESGGDDNTGLCPGRCASFCAGYISSVTVLRRAIFNTVIQR